MGLACSTLTPLALAGFGFACGALLKRAPGRRLQLFNRTAAFFSDPLRLLLLLELTLALPLLVL